jgi:CrcB protein
MLKVLLVLVGGGLGSVSRYGITLLAGRLFGSSFPVGTLCVNLVGCFLIGVAFALGAQRNILSPSARLLVMTGFLGGLTTFSTYALESMNFTLSRGTFVAVSNILANNILGLILVLLGMKLGKVIL